MTEKQDQRTITVRAKGRFVKSYIYSTVLHGAEAWTMNKEWQAELIMCYILSRLLYGSQRCILMANE